MTILHHSSQLNTDNKHPSLARNSWAKIVSSHCIFSTTPGSTVLCNLNSYCQESQQSLHKDSCCHNCCAAIAADQWSQLQTTGTKIVPWKARRGCFSTNCMTAHAPSSQFFEFIAHSLAPVTDDKYLWAYKRCTHTCSLKVCLYSMTDSLTEYEVYRHAWIG